MQPTDEEAAPSTHKIFESLLQVQDDAGRLGREAMAKFFATGPVLVDAMRHQSGQGEKVRQIIWSIYTGSHLVPLGHACAGLDTKVAEAVAAVITARLLAGAEIEEKLKILMTAAGEFTRCDETEATQATKGLPLCYPIPMESPARLRELADTTEASKL
ncbi:hypothetical protein [Luteolibacter sp.]|uniref:hypothetical protein n=1 Tax=Luteolibacter sp. TaxID=1962973 RepID=UPI003264B156